jgi:hypothetical protein
MIKSLFVVLFVAIIIFLGVKLFINTSQEKRIKILFITVYSALAFLTASLLLSFIVVLF